MEQPKADNDVMETAKVSVPEIPVQDIESLKPLAKRLGYSDNKAAVTRMAVIKLAALLRSRPELAASMVA